MAPRQVTSTVMEPRQVTNTVMEPRQQVPLCILPFSPLLQAVLVGRSSDSVLALTRDRLLQVGWTPLHAAANCPSEAATSVVELLLASGAAVDARNGVRVLAAS